MSMNLIVDIGNSRMKVVVMNDDTPCAEYVGAVGDVAWLCSIVERHPEIRRAIVSASGGGEAAVYEALMQRVEYVLNFKSATTPIPIKNGYATPETLGADRLAAAVGGDCDLMIVDFGTAITIDYVEGGVFRGGNISPGVAIRFRALADYTARLPLCSATDDVLEYGTTTVEAIEQGVMQGITNEIEGYILSFLKKKTKKSIIFTGGDAKYFVKRIKNTIFADCEPLILGLNRILNYNAQDL